MRKALVLAGLLVVLVLATYGGPASVAAAQYCSVTCASGYKLECNTASGTCSANSGVLTCCGQQYDCSAINAYSACWSSCGTEYQICGASCMTQECLEECRALRSICFQSCGAKPQISFSC